MAEEKRKYIIQSDKLANDWNQLNEKYIDLEPISFNEFKELFLKTFRYFYKTVKSDTIFRHNALLIKELSGFYAFENYPKGMSRLEYEVCRIVIDGLICAVSYDAGNEVFDFIKQGIIEVEISRRMFDKMEISLDNFESSLKRVMEAYAETY